LNRTIQQIPCCVYFQFISSLFQVLSFLCNRGFIQCPSNPFLNNSLLWYPFPLQKHWIEPFIKSPVAFIQSLFQVLSFLCNRGYSKTNIPLISVYFQFIGCLFSTFIKNKQNFSLIHTRTLNRTIQRIPCCVYVKSIFRFSRSFATGGYSMSFQSISK
jgi:hypothetical protein